jgi:hypothetical protein
MVEADYVARPPGLSEGNYRVWFRNDNASGSSRQAWGLSLDQKLTNQFGLFGRWFRSRYRSDARANRPSRSPS